MTEIVITISLDDDSAARLRELARQRGETVEQTAQALLRATLLSSISSSSAAAPVAARLAPDDLDGSQLIRSLAGSIPFWPGSAGKVVQAHTTNEDIDRILAEEAMNPHENE